MCLSHSTLAFSSHVGWQDLFSMARAASTAVSQSRVQQVPPLQENVTFAGLEPGELLYDYFYDQVGHGRSTVANVWCISALMSQGEGCDALSNSHCSYFFQMWNERQCSLHMFGKKICTRVLVCFPHGMAENRRTVPIVLLHEVVCKQIWHSLTPLPPWTFLWLTMEVLKIWRHIM